MSSTAFSKDTNAEIYVRDMDIQNPLPELLQMRLAGSGQIFYARAGVVVQCIYSDADSLDSFGKDELTTVYSVYLRQSPAGSNRFVVHTSAANGESLIVQQFTDLNEQVKSAVPRDFAH